MKQLVSLFFYLQICAGFAQNYTYDFGLTPQSALLNPSYSIESNRHITIPIIGSNVISVGISGISAHDVFADNAIPIQDKIENAAYDLSLNDIFQLNQKMEFVNIGYRLESDTYLSFGIYEEADVYSTIPVELLHLFFEGTSFPGKEYSIDNFVVQSDLSTVYHVGLQKNVTSNLSIGGRFKLYNVAANISTTSNSGSINSNQTDNTYSHSLNDVDITIRTSGIGIMLDEDNKIIRDELGVVLEANSGNILSYNDYSNVGYIGKKLFFSGSKGIGVDFGVSYLLKENVSVAASVIDLGFIFNTKQTNSYTVKGNYTTESLAFEFDPDRPSLYADRLIEELGEYVPFSTDESNYFSLRPFQLYSSIKYSFGLKRRNVCEYYKNVSYSYASSFGAMFHAQNRPDQILYDVSVFYDRSFNSKIFTRINYTVDKFSYTNIGLAVSANVWKLNVHAGMNNVLAFSNLAKANSISANFGINLMLR